MQDDDRPAALISAASRHRRHRDPQHAGVIVDGRGVDLVDLDLDDPPAPPPSKIETGVDGQAMEPGVEPLGVTQPRQVVPSSDKRLLDRIAGQLRIPEDEAGGPVQPRDGPVGELGEGVMIAPPCSLDESSLVHDRSGTPRRTCR